MQIAKTIANYLMAIVFIVFGLNFFFNFIPMGNDPMPEAAQKFFGVMSETGYMKVVKILEVAIGVLFLLPKTRALAAILIAPITVNILLFELLIAGKPGIGVALVAINAFLLWANCDKYRSILD